MIPALDYVAEVFSQQCHTMYWVQFIGVAVIAYFLHKLIRNTKWLPPGPIGLPFFGYRPFLGRHPEKKIAELCKKYGNVISMKFGPKLVVIVNDYQSMKEAFSHSSALFRPQAVFDHMSYMGFATVNGPEWVEQRRFCVQSARDLGLGRGRWQELIQEEVTNFLELLKSHKGEPVDISDELAITVSNNVLSLLIGRRLDPTTDLSKIKLANDFLDAALRFQDAYSLSTIMPKLRKMLEFLKVTGFDKAAKIVNDFSNLIRAEVRRHGTGSTDSDSFIQLYLNKKESMVAQTDKHYFTDKNLEGNLKVLFVGGADTISVSLGWLLIFMAAFPDIQKKVQEELDEVIGIDGKITYEERFKIPYTFAVLLESQRCATTTPLPTREAGAEFELQGHTIPEGTQIIANFWAIHHDPKYWVEPDKFDPERFLNEDKTKCLTSLPSFVPFSVGRRNCPGETVAWMEILAYFTSIMQTFNISAPKGEKLDFAGESGFISRAKPQPFCFRLRSESH